jgi:hypothetical protein
LLFLNRFFTTQEITRDIIMSKTERFVDTKNSLMTRDDIIMAERSNIRNLDEIVNVCSCFVWCCGIAEIYGRS